MSISLYSFIFAVTLAVCTEAGPLYNFGNSININSGGGCGTVIVSGLNDSQINEIVNAHIANNRGPLTWSKELAAAAQTIANQCGSGGMRINWNGSSRLSQIDDPNRDVSFTNIVNSMFKPQPTIEIPTFTMPTWTMPTWTMPAWTMSTWTMPSRRYRDLTGDYTNMFGCGFLETQKGSNFMKRLVCLYGPSRNFKRQN